MEAGLRRAQWDAELRGDIRERHPEVVVQDDDCAPLRREPSHGCIEELPVGERRRRVHDGWSIDLAELDLDDPTTPFAGDVETCVDGQAVKPGIEPVGIAQSAQVSPGSHEGVLDRVSSELAVSKDQARGCVQSREGSAGKHREGVMIAFPRSLDETSLIHGRLIQVARHFGRARMVWRLNLGKGSRPDTGMSHDD
jgi:hypothetical protein